MGPTGLPALAPGPAKPKSYTRLAMFDGLLALGILSGACAVAGFADDAGDALVLLGFGGPAILIGVVSRGSLERRHRPAPSRILSGLAMTWLMLVLAGTGVYLATGTIDRVDNAFVESAAGFSTTALTTLDPESLSVPMQLWRAATQWVGGLVGILAGVVALPMALRGSTLSPGLGDSADERLVPDPIGGRRRILAIYGLFTFTCGAAYALTGMGTRHSIVHALTTVSTGGFSSTSDSFTGFGAGPRTVATIAMIIAGSSYFVLWWLLRGRTRPILRSAEFRTYLAVLVATAGAVWWAADDGSMGDALFTAASAVSTTGFAVGDWTAAGDFVLAVLLIVIATGSMAGSAGGGLRIVRARTLVGFARRELRRQLDPHAVVVLKTSGGAVDPRALERATGYQIAHLGLCATAAMFLALFGVDLMAAIYTGISTVSTHGPGLGVGPYGDLLQIDAGARLLLVPFMLAGRLSVLPLLLGVVSLARLEKSIIRRLRRAVLRWRR